MDVWGGAMVCSTRLILEQTGLTCCCRSQELLSLLGGGGGGGFAWESTSTDPGPNKLSSPLHYASTDGLVTGNAL